MSIRINALDSIKKWSEYATIKTGQFRAATRKFNSRYVQPRIT